MLGDGKALPQRPEVALIFLDDATRYGLAVWVGTSGSTELFLHGLHELVLRHGRLEALFLDQAFRSLPEFSNTRTVSFSGADRQRAYSYLQEDGFFGLTGLRGCRASRRSRHLA